MSHHSLVEDSASLQSARVSQPPEGGDQVTPLALCKFDEHMMNLVPTYKPMSEKELRESMYAWGATEETYGQ